MKDMTECGFTTDAPRAERRRIAVLTRDTALYRKIYLALPDCEVAELQRFEDAAGASVILFDARAGGEIPAGTVAIVRRCEGSAVDARLPYPFSFAELRRAVAGGAIPARLTLGEGRSAILDGEKIRLTEKEHALLAAILSGRGKFVSRDELLSTVFGEDADGGLLNVYVHYLREKLEGGGERIIISSRRGGYKINERYIGGDRNADTL